MIEMLPEKLQKLIQIFQKFPGAGPHQAARIAFWFLNQSKASQEQLVQALNDAKIFIKVCPKCFMHFEASFNKCIFCENPDRDQKIVAVVAKEQDALAIEATGRFKGIYHILGGTISSKKEAASLHIKEFLERVTSLNPKSEIVLAFDQTTDGEATSLYLKKSLEKYPVKITRIGRGLPSGGAIEYTDEETMLSAMENRK